MNKETMQYQIHNNIIKNIASLTLSGLYICAILFPSLHKIIEHSHENEVFCSATAEDDPCHQAVYHHNFKKGCHHNAHLHAPKHECELCDVIPTQTHIFQSISFSTITVSVIQTVKTIVTQIILNSDYPAISLRGPPLLS